MNERGTKKECKLESYISTYLLMDKISQYGWHHHVGFSNFFSSFLFIFSFVFRRQEKQMDWLWVLLHGGTDHCNGNARDGKDDE